MGPSSKAFLTKMGPMSKEFWWKSNPLGSTSLYASTCEYPPPPGNEHPHNNTGSARAKHARVCKPGPQTKKKKKKNTRGKSSVWRIRVVQMQHNNMPGVTLTWKIRIWGLAKI